MCGVPAASSSTAKNPHSCVGVVVGAFSIAKDPPRAWLRPSLWGSAVVAFLMGSCGACIAFVLLFTELKIVQLSSGLTLSVAGTFKELLTVVASAIVLHDVLTEYNLAGLGLCLVGIAWYNCITAADHGSPSPPSPRTSSAATAAGDRGMLERVQE